MHKIMDLYDNGELKGRMIHCTACGCGHLFDNRWAFNGDYEKPTFSPSMLVRGCLTMRKVNGDVFTGEDKYGVCHSFVTDGKIQYLSDCTHEHAGKTIELEDID